MASSRYTNPNPNYYTTSV